MQSSGEAIETERNTGDGGEAGASDAKPSVKKSSMSKKTAARSHYRRLDTTGFLNWKVQVSVLLLFSAAVAMFLFHFFYGTSVMSTVASQSTTTIYREERRVVQRALVFHTREAVLAGVVHDHHSCSSLAGPRAPPRGAQQRRALNASVSPAPLPSLLRPTLLQFHDMHLLPLPRETA
jgi:hypothetical protein